LTLTFVILALLTIAGAAAVLTLRNLVHCVLALMLSFVGLAGLYLQLGAQFVGFAQVLVYIGAVAILIVFATLLTRSAESVSQLTVSPGWIFSSVVAITAFGLLVWAIRFSVTTHRELLPPPDTTVKQIGDALMSRFVLPLEIIGVLLTVALVGAVAIAMREKREVR
jgi:NADH-quinone oxidoreductase subunit J